MLHNYIIVTTQEQLMIVRPPPPPPDLKSHGMRINHIALFGNAYKT